MIVTPAQLPRELNQANVAVRFEFGPGFTTPPGEANSPLRTQTVPLSTLIDYAQAFASRVAPINWSPTDRGPFLFSPRVRGGEALRDRPLLAF